MKLNCSFNSEIFTFSGILKCVLIKEKMLDENGQMLGDEGWAQFIDGLVPSNLMELAEPRLTKCKAALGKPLGSNLVYLTSMNFWYFNYLLLQSSKVQ